MRRFVSLVVSLLITLSLCSCSVSQKPQEPENAYYTFSDDLAREVSLQKKPERVLALIGSFADIWCLAGGKDSLVAAASDTWTSFSLDLSEDVVNIGTVKEPNLELILSAQADLILASCNTAADMELLDTFDKVGIPVACFDVQSFPDYLRMLKICTDLTETPEAYIRYGELIRSTISEAQQRQDGSHPTVLSIRATGSSCKIKGSRDNLLGEMLADLGCINIADQDSMLEDLSMEEILREDPDYIFIVLQGSDPTAAEENLRSAFLSDPAWQSLSAVKENRCYYLDHHLFNLKPNAKWGDAYEKLADILYPQ